jgi:nicotinate-nucleotide adenylyltransferase
MKDIILFGGTFDPPHVGHLLMAQLALEQCEAEEIWFLPAPAPPHKQQERPLGHDVRLRMVELLIQGYEGMKVCDIESTLPRPSYTVDTVRACIERFPDCRFRFLLGSDSLASLPTWREADTLANLIEFIVAVRAGYPFAETLERIRRALPAVRATALEMPIVDVSSTFVRERLSAGRPVCGLVPPQVLDVWLESTGK